MKYTWRSKCRDFRLAVIADLDGSGKRHVIVTDSRGHLYALDHNGRLRLEVNTTTYRLGTPSVGDVNGDGRPELIFGTEAGEVLCITAEGRLLWRTQVEGPVGRSLPLVADIQRDGRYEVLIPISFNCPRPGVYALDAVTGKQLWKSPALLQSYRSTVVTDIDGDGRPEVLFGDKSTRMYCVDVNGSRLWERHLGGRGIFFAPAAVDLQGDGQALLFAVVRGSGEKGESIYVLDPRGCVVGSLVLPGGGGSSPVLCRFAEQKDVRLVTMSGSGVLRCYRLPQKVGAARILWPGHRDNPANTGFLPSNAISRTVGVTTSRMTPPLTKGRGVGARRASLATSSLQGKGLEQAAKERSPAVMGTNTIPLSGSPTEAVVETHVKKPGGSLQVNIHSPSTGLTPRFSSFTTRAPGDYEITLRWLHPGTNALLREKRFVYRLAPRYREDRARLQEFLRTVAALRPALPGHQELADHCAAAAKASFERAIRSGLPERFDTVRAERSSFRTLLQYCARARPQGGLLVQQIPNPWPNLDATALLSNRVPACNRVSVNMLGNAYASAAMAITNLRPYTRTLRIICSPFRSASGNVVAAEKALTMREVLHVLPNTTGRSTEDPLPPLGDAETIRLAPCETRKIWLTFHSRDFTAGKHRAMLRIGDIDRHEPPSEVSIEVGVSPIRLPDRLTYRHCNWLYLANIPERLREAALQDALEHGTNVFNIPSVTIEADATGKLGQAHTEPHDTLVKKLRGRAFFLINGSVNVKWPAGVQPEPQAQDAAYAEAIRWYARHMHSLGCDYGDYALYMMDEPGLVGRDVGFDRYVEAVKRVKEADPQMQLYANPAGGASAEVLKPLIGLIDVWSPDLHLVRTDPERLGEIFRRGKEYWHYEAPADQRNLDPLGFYRMKPWVAWQLGMSGGGYWVYSASGLWFPDPVSGAEYGTVYLTDTAVVTTKRWEAAREGHQDFELLTMLKSGAEKADEPLRTQALKLLDEAVGFVTQGQERVSDINRQVRPYTPDYGKWMAYREALVRMLERLP